MPDATKQGGYAYPREIPDIVCSPEEATQIIHEHSGMTLRDQAALAALQGLLANEYPEGLVQKLTGQRSLSVTAWAVADAFIAAREAKTDD